MDYQVWTKEEYGDTFTKVDCGDLTAAKRELDKAVRLGREPILTVEVPYSLTIKVEDVGTEKPHRKSAAKQPETKIEEASEGEVTQDKPEPGEGPGVKSEGEV